MKSKPCALILLLLLYATMLYSQQKIDSLLKELDKHTTEDTVRLYLLIATGTAYQRINPDKGIEISDSAISLAEALHETAKLADASLTKANNYFAKAENSEALKWYQHAFQLYQQEGIKKGMASTTSNIGAIYSKWGDYYKAIDNFEFALKIYKELNLKSYELIPLSNISTNYSLLSNLSKSLEYAQKALEIAEDINDINSLPTCYSNIGNIYLDLSEFNTSMAYYTKAHTISKQSNNKIAESAALQRLGSVFFAMEDYYKALEYYERSMEISDPSGFKSLTLYNLVNIGGVYSRLKDYENAIKYHNKALPIATMQGSKRMESAIQLKIGECLVYASDSALIKNGIQVSERYDKAYELVNKSIKQGKEINSVELQRDAYDVFTQLDSAKKDYTKALQDYKDYIIFRDSIINDKKRREIEHIFQHIGILSLEFHVDKLSRPLL